jgi:hypothetical protein
MEAQKNKDKVFELRDYPKNASNFFYKVTKINLAEELPQIQVLSPSEMEVKGAVGFQKGNQIFISKEEWENIDRKGRKFLEGVVYHEFFHWAVLKSGFRSNFEGERLVELSPERNYRFALPLNVSLIRVEDKERINPIEEGTADFFAAKLISKNENEIPINMFFGYFYENPSTSFELNFNSVLYTKVRTAIKEVYTTYQKLDGLQSIVKMEESLKKVDFQMQELVDKYYNLVPIVSKKGALHGIGRVTVLFAYEIYKKENKNSEQLLKDLIYNPWEIVEKVVREIKRDKDKKILKNTISDLSEGFKEHLRGEEKKPSFIKKLVTKVEEFIQKIVTKIEEFKKRIQKKN